MDLLQSCEKDRSQAMEVLALLLLFSMLGVIIAKDLLGFELTSFVDNNQNYVTVVPNNTNLNFEAGLTICFRAKIQFWIKSTILDTKDSGQIAFGLYEFRNDIYAKRHLCTLVVLT